MPTDTTDLDTDAPEDERVSLWGRWRRRRFRRRSFFWRWRRLLFLAMLVVVASLAGLAMVLSNIELPPQTDQLRETSFICTREVTRHCGPDNAAAELSGEENRVVVPYRRMPQILIDAVIAAEDQNFWEHNGIDPAGIARAGWAQLRGSSESQQGGSTITQQYVKIVYLTRERTLARKIREAIYAVELERELTKQEILERYLNTVYFGRGAYGVQAAAQAYFGQDVENLTLAQSAYLAGLIRAPESADAARNPNEATRRRNTTLDNMLELETINQQQYDRATSVEWTILTVFGVCVDTNNQPVACGPGTVLARTQADLFKNVRGHEVGAEYFYESVRQQLVDLFGEDQVYGGGLRVYTTLDLAWQEQAYQTVVNNFPQPGPESSIVAVGADGRVRAMMGGRDFNVSELNLAMGQEGGGSGRQPGSTFKAFAVAEAIAQGYSAEARLPAPSPLALDLPGGEIWNVSGGGASSHSILSGTQASSNVFFAQLMLKLGPENVINMAHRLGVESDLPIVPSLVLGSGEVSVLDMASAYSTFRDHGLHHEPVLIERVEDSRGNVLYDAGESQPQQVISPEVADTVTTALRGVVSGGTGTAAQLSGWSVAGKTGTTQNNKDAWFVGYTCKVSTAVWVGNVGGPGQDIAPLPGQGGTLGAPAWHEFMQRLVDNNLMVNDDGCDLADLDDFPGREFEDVEIEGEVTATCPAGYTPLDTNGDGTVDSCAPIDDGQSPSTTEPPDTTPPTSEPPPSTTDPPTTVTVTVPGPPGNANGNGNRPDG
jgi:penicillin-binding protein 1A